MMSRGIDHVAQSYQVALQFIPCIKLGAVCHVDVVDQTTDMLFYDHFRCTESRLQLQKSECMGLIVAVTDYAAELLVHFLLQWVILTAMMDSSMSASMVAFAMSVDSIPLPEFVSLDVKYICVYCHQILNMPRQLPCGHRICKLCVDKLFQDAVGRLTVCCPSGDMDCDCDITAEQVMNAVSVLYCFLIIAHNLLPKHNIFHNKV